MSSRIIDFSVFLVDFGDLSNGQQFVTEIHAGALKSIVFALFKSNIQTLCHQISGESDFRISPVSASSVTMIQNLVFSEIL